MIRTRWRVGKLPRMGRNCPEVPAKPLVSTTDAVKRSKEDQRGRSSLKKDNRGEWWFLKERRSEFDSETRLPGSWNFLEVDWGGGRGKR